MKFLKTLKYFTLFLLVGFTMQGYEQDDFLCRAYLTVSARES